MIISFDTDEDMDKAFFELIYNSNEGFTGINEREIYITKAQYEMLRYKDINVLVIR
jgi:hypothetical protein